VFYNGIDDYAEHQTLRLSDMFNDKAGIPPALELTVDVYNINEGHNETMLGKSQTLKGYSIFVKKTREFYEETGSKVEAITKAVRWCIKEGILQDYLQRNGGEVENMLLTEWNMEEARKVWEEEASARTAAKFQAQLSAQQAQLSAQQAEITELKRQLAQVEHSR
jgi:hypothetical protein